MSKLRKCYLLTAAAFFCFVAQILIDAPVIHIVWSFLCAGFSGICTSFVATAKAPNA